MKLYHWRASPHACKVLAVAKYLDLFEKIEEVPMHPWEVDSPLTGISPIGKVPVLIKEDGEPVFDSDVICLYLAQRAKAESGADKGLYPEGDALFTALRQQVVASSIKESAVLCIVEEHARPRTLQSHDWIDRQRARVASCLLFLEDHAHELDAAAPTIGDFSVVMALAYLNYRFPSYVWHPEHPKLTQWYEQMLRHLFVAQSLPMEVHTFPVAMVKLEK